MTRATLLLAGALICLSAKASDAVTVTVGNTLDFPRHEMIELDAADMLQQLGTKHVNINDANGSPIPSQTTYDGKLIFPADVDAKCSAAYTISATSSPVEVATIATGRQYPERNDDMGWENEFVGFRAYGPTTQRNNERAFGYDIFFKHPNPQPVLDILYASQTSSDNWRKVDSLRRIDPALASEFQNSFTYHIDHGLGMDCYAVGATLGDGVAVPLVDDQLQFAWCYDSAKVLDNGPLRFTMQLDFAPRTIGPTENVAEHRIISLDAGSNLNRAVVWYDGLTEPVDMAAGFPLRDVSPAGVSPRLGTLAYADPTQGPDNGKALLGLVMPEGNVDIRALQDHVLATTALAPGDRFDYLWGFAWDRGNFADMGSWLQYLEQRALARRNPLSITIE